jgi:MFS family permease
MNVVAALTGGDSDFVSVGRNGVFFDRKGRDWDATVVKVVVAPISVRQAFFAPYKRLARFITEQVEKFAASKEKEQDASLAAGVSDAGSAPASAAASAGPAPFDVAKFAGIFAALGLAVGSIGGALAAAAAGLWALRWWQMPLAVVFVLLVVSTPSMLLAAMKLRLRNLAPLLDACGWAINSRVFISIPFGATLTQLASLPPGSSRSLYDPYAARPRRWPWVVALVVLAAAGWWLYSTGQLETWFHTVFPKPFPPKS